jgi:Ca2+-binding EF-hand superfamily protein
MTCVQIVGIWITSGTLFYSFINDWPIPQSFFYAVDAGMSIGFCTDVAETRLVSKAFTIVYILLGASVVGGALALFIQDSLEGIADNRHDMKEYRLLLEREVFEGANVSQSGVLSFQEFRQLLRASTPEPLSDDDVTRLFQKFDHLKDGVIHFEEFAGTYRGIDGLIASLRHDEEPSKPLTARLWSQLRSLTQSENLIYYVFIGWTALGIVWGMVDQGWDVITATHFAVSAMATGGLTAPSVDSNGILPAEPAIFCGFYCLFGIPLMVVALSHFARVLVAGHVAAMERDALTRPFTASEYHLAKHNLTHAKARGLHLGDFVTLQMLRQGRLNIATFNVLKNEFDILDKDRTGVLTLEEAISWNLTKDRRQTSDDKTS